jgi:actin-related protein 6
MPSGGLFEDGSGVSPECSLIVDLGYSFTHIIPIRAGEVLWDYVKRYVPASQSS